MAEYYSKEQLLECVKTAWQYDMYDLEDFLAGVPTADVVEVKHGEWLDDIQKITTPAGVEYNGIVGYKCSLCGRREGSKEPYCNCGAKMDGRREE